MTFCATCGPSIPSLACSHILQKSQIRHTISRTFTWKWWKILSCDITCLWGVKQFVMCEKKTEKRFCNMFSSILCVLCNRDIQSVVNVTLRQTFDSAANYHNLISHGISWTVQTGETVNRGKKQTVSDSERKIIKFPR